MAPYYCPRCGYVASQKCNMRKHFYSRSKPCPVYESDIELSDDIKEFVLTNHVYRFPKNKPAPCTVINQVINNFHQINNVVTQMDPLDKLNKLVEHRKLELVEFDDYVENTYDHNIKKLESGQLKYYSLNKTDFLNIIDTLTCVTNLENFNVLYDAIPHKIRIYSEGIWKSYLFEAGIGDLIQRIKDCYLDKYELYMIKKYKTTDIYHARCTITDSIMEYYRFIACYDMIPYVYEKTDGEILGSLSEDHELEEYWYGKYRHVKSTLLASEAKAIKNEIGNIVKRNTKSNIVELNKRIMDLIRVDDDFKSGVIAQISGIINETS